jgi:hypothetical protein
MKQTKFRSTVRVARSLAAGALLSVFAFTSGCLALAAGAGAGAAVAYMRGDLDVTLDANLAKSVRAAEKAIAQLKYARISIKQDALQATLISRNASDQKIELYLEKLTDDATKLKIRVGTFGEESLQQEILTRIKSNI